MYHGRHVNKKINPFKEDTFSLGMTFLQMATLQSEEELTYSKELIRIGKIDCVLE
jgi:hypothetical protein